VFNIRTASRIIKVSRHPMRLPIPLALMLLCPVTVLADVQWHDFGHSGRAKETIEIGRISVTIEPQTNSPSYFPWDDLVITVRQPGRDSSQLQFTSAYGFGSVAVHGNILLLKYGIGRGAAARVDHIKALQLDRDLDELADVQTSFYVLTNPHNAMPDLFEYRFKIQTEGGYTTLSFTLPKRQRGIPSEKIVRLKNDG